MKNFIDPNEKSIQLKKINNNKLDFKKFLRSSNSVKWIECNNLEINIEGPINKLIFKKCKNIKLSVDKTISGIEINRCDNIHIYTSKNRDINHLDIFKSSIILDIYEEDLELTNIIKDSKSSLVIENKN